MNSVDIFDLEQDDSICTDEIRGKIPPFSQLLPYTVLWEGFDAQEAYQQYLTYRKSGELEGFTPVFLADDSEHFLRESVFYVREEHAFSPSEIIKTLQKAEKFPIDHFFSHSFARLSLQWRQIRKEHKCRLYHSNRLTSGFGSCSFVLLKIPTSCPWELPAYLPFCQSYSEMELDPQVSILRAWKQKYGVQLLCIHVDMVQMIFDKERMNDELYHSFARELFCVQPHMVSDYYLNFDNLVYNLKHGEQPVFLFYWN